MIIWFGYDNYVDSRLSEVTPSEASVFLAESGNFGTSVHKAEHLNESAL